MFALLLAASCATAPAVDVSEPGWSAGPLEPQFRFAVLADPHITSADGDRPERLAAAVDWINAAALERDLRFVLVLGDIAWSDGFDTARGALARLEIPYVPINGDNEVQFGADGTFDEVFLAQYQTLSATFDGWEMGATAVHDLDADRDTWFHNLAFDYQGVRFVGLDWASRHLGGPESELGVLHDYPDGTMPFLRSQLPADAASRPLESVVLFSHIPMHLGGFDLKGTTALTDEVGPVGGSVWANLAGHYHFDGEERVEEGGYDVIVSDAVWDDDVEVRVVSAAANEETFSWRTEIVVVE